MKTCRSCSKEFKLSPKNFYRNKTKADGYTDWCIECTKERQKMYSGRELVGSVNDYIDLSKVMKRQYKIGQNYEVKERFIRNRRRTIRGELIQETTRMIVLACKNNQNECFLKIDFIINDKEIREI